MTVDYNHWLAQSETWLAELSSFGVPEAAIRDLRQNSQAAILAAKAEGMREAAEICAKMTSEANAEIAANLNDIMPSKKVEYLWLGRKIGSDDARAAILARANELTKDTAK